MNSREAFEKDLCNFISYDPDSGNFTWKESPHRKIKAGDPAGSLNREGYLRISVKGRAAFAHRVAWFFHYGSWPQHQIDHLNRDPADNRIVNLRDVPQAINMRNTNLHRANCNNGFPGIRYRSDRVSNPWRANIKVNGKTIHLGCFDSPEEAHAAYLKAKEDLHEYKA